MIELVSSSVADTQALAAAIAGLCRSGDMIVLSGEMGAGKTAFAGGFARGLGVHPDEPVNSPTFTLVHTYDTGRLTLHHADLYRLASLGEVEDLGLREMADMGAVVLIEWGNVVLDHLGDVLVVTFEHDDDDEDTRIIEIDFVGHAWDTRWDRMKMALADWMVDQ